MPTCAAERNEGHPCHMMGACEGAAKARLEQCTRQRWSSWEGKDPDFPAPETQARWIADRLNGQLMMVPDAGHYQQAEFPEVVSPAVVEFARRITRSVA